ncbi:MAG: DegV family protein, partial [Tumebacillaceae bacterium]
VTDSTSDLSPQLIEEHQIEIIPLNVIINGTTYADGVEISKEQFYHHLQNSKDLPTTSQPSPAMFRDRFQQILDNGDDIYYVGLASTLSGTMQAAKIARNLLDEPERVTIFDTLNVAFAQGLLAMEAAKLVKAGKNADEITATLTALRAREHVVIHLASLDNIRRSGRINNLAYLFGSLLNIKPILMIDNEGVVQVYERARGKKNAHAAMLRYLQEFVPDENYVLGVGHTTEPEKADAIRAELAELGIHNTVSFEISGVIGAHAGYGAIGFIYFARS